MDWQPIEDAPRPAVIRIGQAKIVERERILVAFYGDNGWVYFTAFADGPDTSAPGCAKPTIWCKIEQPADIWKEE